MKFFILISLACLAVELVSADIAIDNNNRVDKYFKADLSEVNQGFVQLIWADNLSGQAGINAALGIGEHLLTSFTTFAGFGGTWDDNYDAFAGLLTYANVDVEGADINNGYLFYRVFESGAIAKNDFYLQQYAQGPTLDVYVPSDGGEPPSLPVGIYEPNGTLGGTLSASGGAQQVIPEPAVASLIVIFGGGLLIGKRLFSKS